MFYLVEEKKIPSKDDQTSNEVVSIQNNLIDAENADDTINEKNSLRKK